MLLGPATSPIALFHSTEVELESRLADHRRLGHVTVVAHCEPLGPRRRQGLPRLRADAVLRLPAQAAESARARLDRLELALSELCWSEVGLETRLALIEAGAGLAAYGLGEDACDALEIALNEVDVLVSRLLVFVRAPRPQSSAYEGRWRRLVASLPRTARVATAWLVDPGALETEVVVVAAGFLWSQPHDPTRMVACGGGAPFPARRVPAPRNGLRLLT
ncbi:MAG TPA: hypothetical protein QGF58_29605 [Myxococcota bacterium]|nr:hypothetical protein [Myxococcota bacterium]